MGYRAVVIRHKESVAENAAAFALEKTADFTFTAGQFIRLKIINPKETDERGTLEKVARLAAEWFNRYLIK